MSSASATGDAHRNLMAAAADWVARLSEPDAPESEFREWQEWLGADPQNLVAYEEMERIWALTAQVPERSRVQPVAAEAEIPAVSRSSYARSSGRMRNFAIAASVLVLAGAGAIAWIAQRPKPAVFETATSEQRSLKLADGSQVILGAETRVDVNLGEKRRALELERGIAYFKVAHDTSRPFVVSGHGHTIEAVGTAFAADSKPERLVVTVTEGTVKVSRGNGTNETMLVHAGHRASVDDTGLRCLATSDASGTALGWRDGRLEYLREELRFVIADVNRYTNRKIVLDGSGIGRLEFTGTVFLEHLDEWLASLPGSFPLKIAVDDTHHVELQVSNRSELAEQLAAPAVANDDVPNGGC